MGMIDVQHLSKRYHTAVAVHDASFSVQQGEILVLLGTSGSGKTTTLRMINRLIAPDSGSVMIDSKNVLSQSPEQLRRRIGYVLQGYGLFPHYTVAENIAIVPKLLKWNKQKINNRVDELLHKLQLPPQQYRNIYPSSLSGGQRQRIGLARALAADPPILLMDEPFGALDPITKTAIRKEFKQLDELKKKTVILVTHDVQEACELGDKIVLMDKGRVTQSATPLQMLLHPVNSFARNFFDHQRLQLEWTAISLKAIWNELPDAGGQAQETLNSESTIWHAMEWLVGNGRDAVALDKETGGKKQVTFTQLQSAFQQMKRKI